LVTPAHPARAGQYVSIFAVGLGPVTPPVAAGIAPPAEPLARATRRPFLRVGGQLVEVEYCGLAPNAVGFYQVNARLPARLRAGEHDVWLEIGGARSNVVTIPIGG
jgi:uncharacterized protein (TIGR03437 family)